jgi:hypothetical protein
MMGKINVGRFKSTWVLRHRWEANDKKDITHKYEVTRMRKNWQLGIFAKRYEAVGSTKRGETREDTARKTFTKSNHVNCYMIGLNLIVCIVWVDFRFKPTL